MKRPHGVALRAGAGAHGAGPEPTAAGSRARLPTQITTTTAQLRLQSTRAPRRLQLLRASQLIRRSRSLIQARLPMESQSTAREAVTVVTVTMAPAMALTVTKTGAVGVAAWDVEASAAHGEGGAWERSTCLRSQTSSRAR